MKRKGIGALLLAGMLFGGVIVAWIAAYLNGAGFGFYLVPLMLCVDVFILSTVGFFYTDGKKEVLYGACSMAAVACAIVQLAVLF